MDGVLRGGMQPLPMAARVQTAAPTAPVGPAARQDAPRQAAAAPRDAAPARSVDTRKRITDTDAMLSRIDSKLGQLGIDVPEKKNSFLRGLTTLGKAFLSSIMNIPKILANAGIILTKAVCNIPRIFTYPLRNLVGADAWMKGKLQGMNEAFDAAKKKVGDTFDGINASIVRLGGPQTPAAAGPGATISGRPDGRLGDAPDMMTDGAMGMVNVQAGILATNIMDGSNFRINENINDRHLGQLTTHNDGDRALDMGAAPLVLGTANTMGQIDDGLNRVRDGRALMREGEALSRNVTTAREEAGADYVSQVGRDMVAEGRRGVQRAEVSMVQNTLGGINAVAGSNRYGTAAFGDVAIGVTNVTQLAGHGLTALTATYDGVMDARAAHSGRMRSNRADAFLERTAQMQGAKKTVESLDTSEVRDGVKLFRKNQEQNFKHKTLSSIRNFVVAAAATTLLVATAVAVAATPVGWAIMGAAAIGAVGFGLYKAYKGIRRQENMQQIGDRLTRVNNEIARIGTPPAGAAGNADRARLGELKDAQRMIQRYQRQTDPAAAAAGLVRVLNSGETPAARANATEALKTVFKINPEVLQMPPTSRPYQLAMEQLTSKLAIFA